MSFRCDSCGKPSPHNMSCRKRVTETRRKEYPNGSVGVEMVRESKLCAKCAHKWDTGHKG